MSFRGVLAVLALAVAIAGCRTAPLMNIEEQALPVPAGKAVTLEQVRSAILRGGGALGWQMRDEGPNKVVGTLTLRDHTAVVDIPYSTRGFSIKYRSSINLNESAGRIHNNYNGWVQNLQRGINTQLSML